MEHKYNEATLNRPEGDRPIDAPVVLIDLPAVIDQIKNEKAWDKNDRNALTVFKSDKLRIVVVGLRRKAEMTTEKPENILSIQVIKGRLRLTAGDHVEEINKEEMVALHENIPYNIVALKKSIFLLTVVE